MDWVVETHANMTAVLGAKYAWLVWVIVLLTVLEGIGAWWHGHGPLFQRLLPGIVSLGTSTRAVPAHPATGEVRTTHVHQGKPYEARVVFDKYTREPVSTEFIGPGPVQSAQPKQRKAARA